MKIYEISESDREEIFNLINSRSLLAVKNSLNQLRESKGLMAGFIKDIEDLETEIISPEERWKKLKQRVEELIK